MGFISGERGHVWKASLRNEVLPLHFNVNEQKLKTPALLPYKILKLSTKIQGSNNADPKMFLFFDYLKKKKSS